MAKGITKWDILKLSSAFDGSFNPADFSEDELAEMLGLIEEGEDIEAVRRRYFEEHDDVKDRTLAIKKMERVKICFNFICHFDRSKLSSAPLVISTEVN